MTFNDIFGAVGFATLSGALFLCAIIGLLSAVCIFRDSGSLRRLLRILMHVQSGLMTTAVLALLALLERSAFEYKLVFETVESSMPWYYRLAGIWSGQAGSLLFWSFVMSLAISLAFELSNHNGLKRLTPTVTFILSFTLFFFLFPDVTVSNPFDKTWLLADGTIAPSFFPAQNARLLVAVDGQGMNPSLRHPAMLSHPPTLYFGLVGLFIPYAFALAALVYRIQPDLWIKRVYRITLAAWIFLTIGMVLGSWWAYTILGWGGYWGWDAVEISGLLPWLLATALIHSMYMINRGRAFQRWAVALAVSIAVLTLFGILITRSGILESVHAYTSSAMGPVLTLLVVLHLVASVVLLISGWKWLGDDQSTPQKNLSGWLLLASNGLLALISLVYLTGQTLPITSEILFKEKLSFTVAQYEAYSSPLWMLFALSMAVYPFVYLYSNSRKAFSRSLFYLGLTAALLVIVLSQFVILKPLSAFSFWVSFSVLLAWVWDLYRRFIKPFIFNRAAFRTLGSVIIHLGFALLAFGILGVERLASYHDVNVSPGENVKVADFSLQAGQQSNSVLTDGKVIFAFPIQINISENTQIALIPLIEHYSKLGSFHAQPDIYSTPLRDIQLVADGLPASSTAPFMLRVNVYPFMVWIWSGGGMLIIGGIMVLLTRRWE